ncbi:polysaccharide pyruvyl transferase family protein [Acinetobacter sp. YH01012]|uniref:polysaccharide pyruvyl transferase family protein n=1 Tax=Acinetobacter sp. YH01012 TaxID=2601028 RepID=UPI0015D2CF7D|nr:polysaccharide pyruvyl transferase family protein [Acinetobacter sp. YH01012]
MFFKQKIKVITPYMWENNTIQENFAIPMYWYDDVSNFGDWLSPWLVSCLAKKPVINTAHLESSEKSLFAIGSIIQSCESKHGEIDIWGSGLIHPLDSNNKKINKRLVKLKQCNIKSIHAVRGALTASQLRSKLNLTVPDIYGDPAMLIANIYEPQQINVKSKISICPHYIHQKYFEKVEAIKEQFNIIDVHNSPESVITQIANSDLCISSSLHGIIIAQAYNIPWVWLKFEGHYLKGDDFKFFDYFSNMLDPHKFNSVEIKADDVNLAVFQDIAKKACVMEVKSSLALLRESFPY